MKKIIAGLLTVSTLMMGMVSCYGSFGLTKTLHNWNGTISNKWINTLVYIIMAFIIPVYGIAMLVDGIVLNTVEFWTGKRLVDADKYDSNGEYTYTEEKANEQVVYTYKDYGKELHMDLYKDGKQVGALVLFKEQPGQFFSKNLDGTLAKLEVGSMESGENVRLTVKEANRVLNVESVSRVDFMKMQDHTFNLARSVSIH